MPDFVPSDESPRHERLQIARDLHDTFAQTLAGIGYALDAVIADETLTPRSKRELRTIRLDLSGLLRELRDEILALRHESESNSESPIEDWLRDRLTIGIGWSRGGFEYQAIPSPQDLGYLLLELITNGIKHQGVTAIEVLETPSSLTVRFTDRDSTKTKSHLSSEAVPTFGRVGVLERAIRIDARLDEAEDGFTLQWQS